MQMSCDCGNKFLVDADQRGKLVQCPQCHGSIRVPDDRGGKPAARPMMVEPEPDDDLTVFACPACGNAMKARASYAGRATRCPKCQASVTIPGGETPRTPPVKKSSAVLFLAVGAGLLFLLGGILAVVMLKEKDRGGASARPEIDDLTLVPANAQGLLSIKLSNLWQTPSVQKSVLESRRNNPDKPDLAQQLEGETGLKPEEIERLTVVSTNSDKKEGWAVVKTKAPYDAKSLSSRIREPQSKSHLDYPYVVGVDSQNRPTAVAPISPTVFVSGSEAGVRQALGLIATPVALGPLAPVVTICRKDDHVVFGYNTAGGRLEGNKGGFDLRSLNDMELLHGTLNIREQAKLDARAQMDSNENAERLRGTTAGWLRTLKAGLGFAQFLPGEQGKEAAQKSKLLNAIKLSAEDKAVIATLDAEADLVLPMLLSAMR